MNVADVGIVGRIEVDTRPNITVRDKFASRYVIYVKFILKKKFWPIESQNDQLVSVKTITLN